MDRAFGPEESECEHGGEKEMMNDGMTNDELPSGWEALKLEDIASWGSGGTPPRRNPKFYGGDIPWIKTGELGDGLILDTEEKITADGLKNSSAKVFPKGSVAIAMYGATIGKVSILGIDAATNQACAVGIPDLRLSGPQYIFQYLRSQKEAFIAAGKGGAQPNLSQGVIKEWPFPLPPLPEQKRIADKLEAVLGRVDACRARLDRVPALLKRFRQSVLASATSGGLTEEWRMTNGVNDEWDIETVGSIITKIEAGLNVMCEERPPRADERGLVKISAVTWGTYDDEKSKTLPPRLQVPEFTRIRVGDFLISRANTLELVGACVIVHQVTRPVFLSDKILRLVLPDEIKPWLLYVLQSPRGRKQIEDFSSGNQLSMRNLAQGNLRQITVPFPTENERREIVRRVEDLFAFADRIEARLATAQKTVERLTPATLAKAFRGELVPQDPNDEPASVLLGRLRPTESSAPDGRGRRKAAK